MSSENDVLMAAHGLNLLVSVGLDVMAIVIILGPVRRQRPDAYGPLLAWAVVSLVAGLAIPAASTLLVTRAARGSVSSVLTTQTVVTLADIPVHLVVVVLLLRGLVKLAQPAKPPTLPETPPYR